MGTEEATRVTQIQQIIQIINHFRTLDPEFPPQIMVLLLKVAMAPGLTVSALAERCDLSQPSVSRNLERLGLRWGGRGNVNRPGAGLVEVEENPANRREKLVKLSRKGELFVQTLLRLYENQAHGVLQSKTAVPAQRDVEQTI